MRRRLSRASEPSALWRTFGRLLPVLAAAFIFASPFTIQAQAQDYTPLEGLRVSNGLVQYSFFQAGGSGCINLSNTNINGDVYTIHTSKWQRRAGATWVDVPRTERDGAVCAYSTTSAGEYRLVAEITIDGERGHYSSENTFTVEGEPPSGGTGGGTEVFSIPDRGGWSTTSSGTAETLSVGYGRIRADAGSTTPSGIAIFQFRDSQGVLISEAGVPATEPVLEGRIFAEVDGPVNTGLAIANPNDVPATIGFYFTDTSGTRFGDGSFELGAHQQRAEFLDQATFNGGPSVLGTFTFTSSVPIAVIALRGFTNEAGEFLMTTLPVAPLSPASEETVYIPHFAAGGGWVTQVILVNPTDSTITGTVGFLGPGDGPTAASPVILTLDDGSTGSDFDYSIPPSSSQRFTTSNPFGALNSGSVRAVPDSGNAAPSGLVVFSYAPAGKTLSESGVPALPKGSVFRVYVEASQVGSINTGLAITNTADTSNTVTLEVTHLDGSLAVAPATLALPPSGQVARFLNQIFSLPDNFSGVLRVTSTADVAIVALRLRVNANGEIKVTTLAPSNEREPSTSEDRFFTHLADSGGWSTQFILFSGTAGQASSGTLTFIDASGQPLDLSVSPPVEIPAPDAPDLVVQTPSVSDSRPNTGETFTLSATVRNQGNGLSASTTLRYYRSTDATISTGDTQVGTDPVSGLSAFGTSDESISLTAPSTAGTYYYGACVDPVSGESDTRNNCSTAVRVTVSTSQMEIAGFDLASVNGNPQGIVYANDRFFVVDLTAAKVYAYQSSGQRDSASDFDLDSANENATRDHVRQRQVLRGGLERRQGLCVPILRASAIPLPTSLWIPPMGEQAGSHSPTTGSSWWIWKDAKVYAYQSWGQRDSASDFALDSANGNARGIVYANNRLFVVDDDDDKVYAYQSSGQRDSASDFDLDSANEDAQGITFANNRFFVVDGDSSKVYVFNPTAPDLVVESPSVSSSTPATGQSFEFRATVRNQGGGTATATTLHYYRSTDSTISTSDTQVGMDAVGALSPQATSAATITLTSPAAAGNYYYGACVDRVVEEGNTGNNCSTAVVVFDTSQMASAGFDLHADNAHPTGIVYANDRFFVVDLTAAKVYAYQSWGQRDSASDFALDSANENALGITFANDRFFVVDWKDAKAYAYQSSGQRDSASDFALDSANGRAGGITFANNRLFVVDFDGDKVYAYQSSGQRDSASDFALDSANGNARGIVFANNRLFVVDGVDDKVYAYQSSGQRDSASDFALDSANENATGITFANNRFYVVDGEDGKVYVFNPTVPDLVVESPSVSSSTPATGQSFEFRATVRNQGGGTATATTLRYYRSTDSTISTSDTQVGTDAVGALSRQATSAESITLTAPSAAGTYYYGACVDRVAEESGAGNNCSSAVRVTVGGSGGGGDAVTGEITECSGIGLGGGRVLATIRGNVQAHRPVSSVYVTGTVNGQFVRRVPLGSISAGQSETFTIIGNITTFSTSLRCEASIEWTELQ